MNKRKFILLISIAMFFTCGTVFSQPSKWSTQTTTIKLGRLWLGMPANGAGMNFDPRSTFFPNDYGIMADRAQYGQAFTGAGITLACARWPNPNRRDSVNNVDTVESPAVYGYTNTYMSNGWAISSITNYLRFKFPSETINSAPTNVPLFGTYNQAYAGFQNTTADEIAEVVDSTVFGVTVDRKVLVWSQNYNDDYVIADLIFTNVISDTLDSLYINLQESGANTYFSNGTTPAPLPNETYDPTMCWQHYYGARAGDSLRVFYEYSAANPTIPGDNMGAPLGSSNGRLIAPNIAYYAILHASQPYDSTGVDADDPSLPRITYAGVSTVIPYNSADDQYGNKNFYAIRGGFSRTYSMPGAVDNTHGMNTDEIGNSNFLSYVASQRGGVSYRTCSFGPYMFYPGQKIHIVIASGFTGIGYEKGQVVGAGWLHGTLENPPNMPDPNTGWFPSNFQFPTGATEMDKRKDRWISMGIDSVMLSAWRAKWNFDHGYMIPQAPPPPQSVSINYTSHAVQINWSDPQAEALSGFAGYRIMRKISDYDTVAYVPVYDSDSTNIEVNHTFTDSTAMYLSQAYYYVQSKVRIGYDDQNADPTTRGKIIFSGRLLYPNIYSIDRPGPAQDNLSKIRIVPNPYNIKDPMQVAVGWLTQLHQYGAIGFFNLPSVCTIKIYTENGDLVRTIIHNQPQSQAGTEKWDLLTSSQQVVFSGIYIAVFQKPDGEMSYQKFIIVR